MSEPLNFHYSIDLLVHEGETIVTAAEDFADRLAARLTAGFTAETRALLTKVEGEQSDEKGAMGGIGTLTIAQNDALAVLLPLLTSAKKTAKKAFRGNAVKLGQEFQVGINKPNNLASILGRARIILASLKNADNLPALTAKSWIAGDTAKIDDALGALKDTDLTQENTKGDKLDTTGGRNHDANILADQIDTLQNAADLEFPASDPANTGTRAKFRLGQFPPKGGSGKTPAPPTPPVTPTT